MNNKEFKRGSIWIVKERIIPALIISDDEYNKNSKLITYITLTRLKKNVPSNIEITLDGKVTYAQCGYIQTDFKDTLDNCVGQIDKNEMYKVERKISEYLSINVFKIYEDSMSEMEHIMNRIKVGKDYVNREHKKERLNLSYDAKMDIMENYTRETRDRLAEKYDIYPRSKVSQIAYSLRSKYKKEGRI